VVRRALPCLALITPLLAACSPAMPRSDQAAGIPVTAGMERATAPGFSIAPPEGHGWIRLSDKQVHQASPIYKVGFGKAVGANTAMAVAGAFVVPEPVDKPEEFLQSFADARVAKETSESSGRLHVLSSGARPMPQGGATCWQIDGVAEDRGVPGHQGEVFTLSRRYLTCSHPDFPAYIVIADYSQRVAAGQQPPSSDEEAESFLRGLAFDRLGKHITTIAIGEKVQGIGQTPGAIWVAYGKSPGMVARIDTRSNKVVARIQVGDWPVGVTATTDAVWVVNNGSDTVSRIDPATNRVAATVQVGKKPLEVAVGADAAWVTNSGEDTISRVDRATNEVSTIRGIGRQPSGIAFADDTVLVTDYGGDELIRINPQTNAIVGRRTAARQSNFILPDGDSIWLNDQHENAVLRLSMTQPEQPPGRISAGIGARPTGLALDGRSLWIANWADDTLSVVDLRTPDPHGRRLPAGSRPLIILAAEGALWVTNTGDGSVLRIEPPRD
jgi:YVTN family beta-propeller protein